MSNYEEEFPFRNINYKPVRKKVLSFKIFPNNLCSKKCKTIVFTSATILYYGPSRCPSRNNKPVLIENTLNFIKGIFL